jgi:hypothetical protein
MHPLHFAGHSYDKVNIETWFRDNDTSPKTGARLPHKQIVPAHALRNAIEEWETKHCRLISRSDISPAVFGPTTLIGSGSFKQVSHNIRF